MNTEALNALIEVVKTEWRRRWYGPKGERVLANGNLRAAIRTLRNFKVGAQ